MSPRDLAVCAGAGVMLLGLVACSNNDGGGFVDLSKRSTQQIVNDEIAQNTSETSSPISINDLPVIDGDASETASSSPV